MGWGIVNGEVRGDEEGEWIFRGGRGNKVIDYVIGKEECREKVKRLRVGDKIDSDHHPIEVEMEGKRVGEEKRGREQNRVGRGVWNLEGRRRFREEIRGMEKKGNGIEEEWERMEEGLKDAMMKTEREVRREEGKGKGWWDGRCREKKEEVRGELRKWRREGGKGEEYRKRRLEYRKLCDEKKKEENDRWERKAAEVKRETEVWEIVNGERKGRKGINKEIELEEWRGSFIKLLGGVENRVVREEERKE